MGVHPYGSGRHVIYRTTAVVVFIPLAWYYWDDAGAISGTDAGHAIIAGAVLAMLAWPVTATLMWRVRDLETPSEFWAPLPITEATADDASAVPPKPEQSGHTLHERLIPEESC